MNESIYFSSRVRNRVRTYSSRGVTDALSYVKYSCSLRLSNGSRPVFTWAVIVAVEFVVLFNWRRSVTCAINFARSNRSFISTLFSSVSSTEYFWLSNLLPRDFNRRFMCVPLKIYSRRWRKFSHIELAYLTRKSIERFPRIRNFTSLRPTVVLIDAWDILRLPMCDWFSCNFLCLGFEPEIYSLLLFWSHGSTEETMFYTAG
jgi:hypothetical protein